ncbi:MAG: hypothetical protein RDU20_14750 [Desulfomonilaceae bacterium]|nr:hypothetical protein [Desulfomonilaceae bacterium]
MTKVTRVAEQQIDDLINAGWDVLESDFDESTFLRWRRHAYACVSELVGAEHPYAEHLRVRIGGVEPSTVLADVGVLTAARLWRFQDYRPSFTRRKKKLKDAEPESSSKSDLAPFCYLKRIDPS